MILEIILINMQIWCSENISYYITAENFFWKP